MAKKDLSQNNEDKDRGAKEAKGASRPGSKDTQKGEPTRTVVKNASAAGMGAMGRNDTRLGSGNSGQNY